MKAKNDSENRGKDNRKEERTKGGKQSCQPGPTNSASTQEPRSLPKLQRVSPPSQNHDCIRTKLMWHLPLQRVNCPCLLPRFVLHQLVVWQDGPILCWIWGPGGGEIRLKSYVRVAKTVFLVNGIFVTWRKHVSLCVIKATRTSLHSIHENKGLAYQTPETDENDENGGWHSSKLNQKHGLPKRGFAALIMFVASGSLRLQGVVLLCSADFFARLFLLYCYASSGRSYTIVAFDFVLSISIVTLFHLLATCTLFMLLALVGSRSLLCFTSCCCCSCSCCGWCLLSSTGNSQLKLTLLGDHAGSSWTWALWLVTVTEGPMCMSVGHRLYCCLWITYKAF